MRANKIALVLAAVVAVAAAGAVLLYTDGETRYSISYELNGGSQNSLNPTTYTPGESLELYDAYDPNGELIFDSWYLDEELTQPVDSITGDMTGDITLYAGWIDSLVGKGMTFTVEGSHVSGLLNSYDIDGTVSYEYLYQDGDGRYLMRTSSELTYTFMMTSRTSSQESTYWTGDSDIQWYHDGTETVSTVHGEKECDVYVGIYADGSSETQWIGDGWIVYRIEYSSIGTYSSTETVYTLTDTYTVETDSVSEVSVTADVGISVEGAGPYSPGDTVTLVATADPGTTFAGWYNADGALLSTSASYTFEAEYGGCLVYAMNTADPDFSLTAGGTLSGLDFTADTAWTVLDGSGDTVAQFTGDPSAYTFEEPGSYTVSAEDPDAGVGTVFTVYVDGTVAVSFEWVSDGTEYTYSMDILYSDVERYRDYYDVSERQQDVSGNHQRDRTFVTYDDGYIVSMAADLAVMTEGMSDVEKVTFLLDFVQSVGYEDDEVYMGYEEYWKFPLETLYDHGGDCEDTSILMAALSKAMGYDSALLILPGHMAAGVSVDGAGGVYFVSMQNPGKRYHYCETTADGYGVGDFPQSLTGYRVAVVAV